MITYLKTMNVEDKMITRLDMLVQDGSPGHIHMINYFTKYRNEIFQYAIIKSDAKQSSIKELTISHLHSYLGMRGYIKGIGSMSAEERMAAYENGLGSMSAMERMAVSEKGYKNGLGSMLAEERMVASEKGYENGLGSMSAEERTAASKKGIQDKRKLSSGSTEEATYDTIDGADENGKYILITETFGTEDQTFTKKIGRRNGKRSMMKFHMMGTINELQLKKCATQSCTNKKRALMRSAINVLVITKSIRRITKLKLVENNYSIYSSCHDTFMVSKFESRCYIRV
jgi:hypothetical protein